MEIMKSENAEKKKSYRIRGLDGCYMGMVGAREFRVVKTFEQTETGTVVKNKKYGYTLDIPAGYIFEEAEE